MDGAGWVWKYGKSMSCGVLLGTVLWRLNYDKERAPMSPCMSPHMHFVSLGNHSETLPHHIIHN